MSTARPRGFFPKEIHAESTSRIKHQEERLKKQRRKGGFDYPKSSETAEANKQTLEIEVDKDDKLEIELPEQKKFNEEKIVEKVSLKHKEVTVKRNQMVKNGNGSISRVGKGATLPQDKIVVEGSQFDDLENDEDDSLEIKLKLETEENLRKLEIERLAEENLRKHKIEGLAEENFSKVNKLFVYPQVVKPDIEVFLNRSLSTLSSEPDVLIMGALNDYLQVGNDPS